MIVRPEQYAALRRYFFAEQMGEGGFADGGVIRDPVTGAVLLRDASGNNTRLTFDTQGFINGVESPQGHWSFYISVQECFSR